MPRAAVRLACVKHAASVKSEPGSNSSVQFLCCNFNRPFNRPIDLTQSEFILLISTSCELLLLCSEINCFCLSSTINFLSPHTHTNRLFYLNFKELFCFRSCRRSVEEVRIIQIVFTSSIYILNIFFVGLRGQDLNLRPLGYEPNELPDCSTPRLKPCSHKCSSQVKPGDFTSVLQNRLRTLYAQ